MKYVALVLLTLSMAFGQAPAKPAEKPVPRQLTDGEKLDLRNIQVHFMSARENKAAAEAEYDRVSSELTNGVTRAYVKANQDAKTTKLTPDLLFVQKTDAELAAEKAQEKK